MEVTMKNAVFWDIKTQFQSHRRHITCSLQSPAGYFYVRFEVFTAVTMKNAVFWDTKAQFILHRKHYYVSAKESSRLMICKTLSFHGGDYEECLLLGHENPVYTSHTYVSYTYPVQISAG
jgi:hypothetical protein